MQVAIDLHIHSALSPCSENEMTPNNIVNMSLLKGLDIIAVTDHNSTQNISALQKCAADKKILLVPGMEIETREEVHLICLFPHVETALKIQETVYKALPGIENREEIFGQQLLFDEGDNIIAIQKMLLVTATSLSIEDVFLMVDKAGGVVIPAHIDRESYSIISNLGMVPETLSIKYLEVSRGCDDEGFSLLNPQLCNYKFIKSSDAHRLGDILERESFIELEEISIECLLKALKN